jgi:hypothetical protein
VDELVIPIAVEIPMVVKMVAPSPEIPWNSTRNQELSCIIFVAARGSLRLADPALIGNDDTTTRI